MFMKKPNHRVFDYPTRFYHPENDETEKRKKKLGFSRQIKHTRKRRSPFIWLIFAVVVIYVILKLKGIV